MGGIGSGRQWYLGARDTTDDFRSIDIRRWKRDGLLAPNNDFNWQWSRNNNVLASIRVQTRTDKVILIYRYRNKGKEWSDERYSIYIDWSDCHLGGKRPWFLCPMNGCGRRVAILYGGGIFACRACHKLAYPSQRESIDDRACRKADNIRDKLGWQPGILNGHGGKPKGMHWNTYFHLCDLHDSFVQLSLTEMQKRFALIGESVEDWL